MALATTKSRTFLWCTRVIVTTYIFLSMTSYFTALSQSLQMAFFDSHICGPYWGLIAAGLIIVPLQVRTFSGSVALLYVNAVSILVVVFVTSIALIIQMSDHHDEFPQSAETELFAKNLTITSFFNGMTKICFCFLGQSIYLEIISEMKSPQQFPITFAFTGPVQIVLYGFAGSVGYLYNGVYDKDSIIKNLSPSDNGVVLRIVAFCLVAHLIIAFLVLGVPLCRKLHMTISPRTLFDTSIRESLIWLAITSTLLILCYVLSNSIPSFGDMVGLVGGLQGPMIGFILPSVFYYLARKQNQNGVNMFEKVVLLLVCIFAVTLIGFGTYSNVKSIMEVLEEPQAGAFSCSNQSYAESYKLE